MIVPPNIEQLKQQPAFPEAPSAQEDAGSRVMAAILHTAVGINEERIRDLGITNKNIERTIPLITPLEVKNEYRQTEESRQTVERSREAIQGIIEKPSESDRLLVVVGPCSIHDPKAAIEYADWIANQREIYGDTLEIVMRTYLEKPRTTIGWKGFIADPHLDGTHDKNEGLLRSRELLVDITSRRVPIAMELLNESTPVYFDDLTSWGCLGARTVESQTHRELASGVSFPMGHKNNTSGDTKVAVEAVRTAIHPHAAEGINDLGIKTLMKTSGNPHNHVILRGGKNGANYDRATIERVKDEYAATPELSLEPAIMIDASHRNSGGDHHKQLSVVSAVANHIREGEQAIIGIMLESNIVAGKQDPDILENLTYGQSISDACIDLSTTKQAFDILQGSVMMRRQARLAEANI